MGRSVVAQLGACILLLGLGVSEAEAQAAGVTEPESVSRFETVDGLRFHYLDWGNESGRNRCVTVHVTAGHTRVHQTTNYPWVRSSPAWYARSPRPGRHGR